MAKIRMPYRLQTMTCEDFLQATQRDHLHFPFSEDLSILAQPVFIGEKCIPNSIAIHPLEGCDCCLNGAPSDLTVERYRQFTRGGAGLIWVEACAVAEDGRDNLRQMHLHKGSVKCFSKMVAAINQEGRDNWGHQPFKVLQLTHSGRESCDCQGKKRPLAAFANPFLDTYYPSITVADDERIHKLETEMVDAALLAAEAGMDAVDIKLCHNYLIRELLAAFTRQGDYGGNFENRTRFTMNVVKRIQQAVGSHMEISVRLNAYDCLPYPYGWGMAQNEREMSPDLTEPLCLAKRLYNNGVHLFNISSMMPRCSPKGSGFAAIFEEATEIQPLEGVHTLLHATRTIKKSVPGALIVASGLSWFRQFGAQVGAGGVEGQWFDIAGFGRQAMANPYFAAEILSGKGINPQKCCVACDLCYLALKYALPIGCVAQNPAYSNVLKQLKTS